MSKRSNKMTLRFNSTTRSQAGVAALFAALSGRQAPPTCPTCGGLTGPDATPVMGRCKCSHPVAAVAADMEDSK